jgi:outer membrane immunogenic protein
MRIRAFLIGLAFAGLATASANAADVINMQPAPAYNPAAFNFNGFYLGAQGGAMLSGFSAGSIGVVAGANFLVADPVMLGIEFQGDWLPGSGGATYDFFVLGRGGVVINNDLMAYGEIGPGALGNTTSYVLGAGAEYALTDQLSLKGELQGFGPMGSGFNAARIQAGILFHLQ